MKQFTGHKIVLSIMVIGGFLLFSTTVNAKDDKADLDCRKGKFDSGAFFPWNKDENKLKTGESITWQIEGEANTTVTFEFSAKKKCDGTSPFDSDQTFDVTIPASGQVEKMKGPVTVTPAEDTCYNYKITCAPPTGDAIIIDPIIEVPKP